MKTEAGQLFLTRRFEKALEAFRKLSEEYPKDIVIKRYMGASLDHLKRDDEAIAAFREVLVLNPEDLPSRQFLGKIYLRKGELDLAEKEYAYIVEHDKQGTFSLTAQSQLQTIRQLKESKAKRPHAAGTISPDEFLKTAAAQYFIKADYEKALRELEQMESRYPADLLIKRYKSLTLDRLGRFPEALAELDAALARVPANIPLRYARAQTLLHQKDFDGAIREYQYIIDHDETGAYKAKAQAELQGIKQLQEMIKQAIPKKWNVNASSGAEWNTNPTSRSRLRHVAPARGHGAWKFSNSGGGSYEIFRRGAWSSRTNLNHSTTLYSNGLNSLNTISNSGGASLTYVAKLYGRALITQLSQTTAHTLVEEEYYNTAFTQSLSMIYSLTDWYRLTLSDRLTWSLYNREGLQPDQTSRDGLGNVFGVTQSFYFDKSKKFSTTVTTEYGHDQTQGRNNIKDYGSYRAGLHFPMVDKWEGDLSFKLKHSYFPKYGNPNTTPSRNDKECVLSVGLSRPLAKHLTLNTNYSLTANESKDGNYTYRNQAMGFSLSYAY